MLASGFHWRLREVAPNRDNFTMVHQEKLWVDFKQLKAMGLPWCRAHVYRMMATGDFPLPLKAGRSRGSRVVWAYQDIINFMEQWRQQPRGKSRSL